MGVRIPPYALPHSQKRSLRICDVNLTTVHLLLLEQLALSFETNANAVEAGDNPLGPKVFLPPPPHPALREKVEQETVEQ